MNKYNEINVEVQRNLIQKAEDYLNNHNPVEAFRSYVSAKCPVGLLKLSNYLSQYGHRIQDEIVKNLQKSIDHLLNEDDPKIVRMDSDKTKNN